MSQKKSQKMSKKKRVKKKGGKQYEMDFGLWNGKTWLGVHPTYHENYTWEDPEWKAFTSGQLPAARPLAGGADLANTKEINQGDRDGSPKLFQPTEEEMNQAYQDLFKEIYK